MLNYSMKGELIIVDTKKNKNEARERTRKMYYNMGCSIEEIAIELNKSQRTIYRYLNLSNIEKSMVSHNSKKKLGRPKFYPPKVSDRIVEIKKELPQRSAPMVHKLVREEFPNFYPSLPYVRKIIQEKGLSIHSTNRKKGYIRFQRKKPNDMWQIDIAGVETVGHLKEVYLIALLDDCSRFVVAAQYFKEQTASNVIKVVRNAVLAYGRPNEILADRSTQFKNVLGELATKYSKLLTSLGIKPIFASPYHPQT